MSTVKLPKDHRPEGHYRQMSLGLDFPAWFYDDLKGIDENLYLVFHKHRTIWDMIINQYAGELLDPRYVINNSYGCLNFGFVLTNGKGVPIEEGKWHLWRLSRPHGWAHIMPIQSRTDKEYLNTIIKRLHLQAKWTAKYGSKSYQQLLKDAEEKDREKIRQEHTELFNMTFLENSHVMKNVKENFERGITKPTNPQKEVISSFSGQTNRSRIVRPLQDEDVLIIPGR